MVDISTENPVYDIITTTDIRDKIIAQDRNPAGMKAREIMNAPVITADPEWTLKECSIKMQANQIQHLPVANEQGTLIGLMSAKEIIIAAEEIG